VAVMMSALDGTIPLFEVIRNFKQARCLCISLKIIRASLLRRQILIKYYDVSLSLQAVGDTIQQMLETELGYNKYSRTVLPG
jgi:hypothetical protein